MEERYQDQYSEPTHTPTLKEHLSSYLRRYPLFLVCLLGSIVFAFLYVRYTIPKFTVHTQMLLKANFSLTPNKASGDLIETALSGNMNINNELQLLQSVSLMERVVLKNAFNILYYKVGNVLDMEVYRYVPFRLVPQGITDSSRTYSFLVKHVTREGGSYETSASENTEVTFKWYQPFKIDGQSFILAPNGPVKNESVKYWVFWKPVNDVAAGMLSMFYAGMLDNKTSIIEMDLTVENLDKGKEVLNAICREYILASMEEKSLLAQNAIQFIDDRLAVVARDLGGVEGNLERFQSSNRITNVEQQSSATFQNSNAADKDILELNNQQSIVKLISVYVSNPEYRNKLVPSTLGLNDPTLSLMVNRYNELQLKKEKEAPYLQIENEIMKDLNNQINGVRASILESLKNIAGNLQLRESSLQKENNKYQQMLSSLPRQDRILQDIKRKQSITEGLYLYLLQKKEEIAISTSTAIRPDYKQIDEAKASGVVKPNKTKVWMISIIAGLILPVLIIYVQSILNDKVTGKIDLIRRTSLPLIGELSHINLTKYRSISVDASPVLSEEFRMIRTRLFLLPKGTPPKVTLITSIINNEGKTFVSQGLAAVLATSGKQVALLNFDLRNPVLKATPGKDLMNFLQGDTIDLAELYSPSEINSSLHLYSAHLTSGNPSDLFLSGRVHDLFTLLRERYDYVVIDAPPIGLVSDAYIIGIHADATLLTVRQGVTPRHKVSMINDLVKMQELHPVYLVLNDVPENSVFKKS